MEGAEVLADNNMVERWFHSLKQEQNTSTNITPRGSFVMTLENTFGSTTQSDRTDG